VRALGGIQVESPGRPQVAALVTQPKRLALLVYLLLARPRGPQRRDALLALFWPDSDSERGRRVLRQTIFQLRQVLGAEALTGRGDEEVQVEPTQVECDALLFERAIAEGRLAEALEHYRGDFLHGFHAPGVASELEDWAAAERRRLREMAAAAARTLSAAEERAGNGAAAVFWARRAAALDPDDVGAVRQLMELLAASGDRSGATRAFDDYARRLARDYDVEPDDHLVQLAQALRAESREGPAPPGTAVARAASAPPAPSPAPALPAVQIPAVPSSRVHRPLRIAGWSAAGGALAVLALVAVTYGLVRRAATSAPGRPITIAVAPVLEARGGDSVGTSGVAAELLATSLARLPGIEVIPALRLADVASELRSAGASEPGLLAAARQAGAGRLLRATLTRRADGTLRLDGQLLGARSGTVERSIEVESPDLFSLVDRATVALAGALDRATPQRPITEATTGSLVALRLYEEGMQAYFHEDPRAARSLFEAAVAEDSLFVMAEYYLAWTEFALDRPEGLAHLRHAGRLADRLPDRERLMIRYRIAQYDQTPAAAAIAETLAVRYPNDPDAQYALGELRVAEADWAGAAAQFRRTIEMDSLSLRAAPARCLACEAYQQLWNALLLADSAAGAERVMREQMRRHGAQRFMYHELALAQLRQSHFADALANWRTHDSIAPDADGIALRRAWVALYSSDLVTSDSVLSRLVRGGAPTWRHEYTWWLQVSLRNQGRAREALPLRPMDDAMRPVLLLETGASREAAALYAVRAKVPRDSVTGFYARQRAWNLTLEAMCLAAGGDTLRLAGIADSVEWAGAKSAYGRDRRLHHYIRGLLWEARGDWARAATEHRAAIWSYSDGYTRANYELARALLALGRAREAIYPLQAALRGDLQSSNLYVTRTELHELLAEAFAAVGARDSAAVHYRLVARAWAHAEAPFAHRRVHAEAFLTRS
jgi:DNA-binding SARP family transcriptional activator